MMYSSMTSQWLPASSNWGLPVAKTLLFSVLTLFIATQATGQVKIGDNPGNITPNSLLELESTNKGLLLPRIELSSTNSAAPLSTHVAGMVVYNTATAGTAPNNVTPGYYFNNGSTWVRLNGSDSQPWYNQASKTAATANTQNVYLMGKVGIGTDSVGSGNTFQLNKSVGLSSVSPQLPQVILNPTEGQNGKRQATLVLDGNTDILALKGSTRTSDGNYSATKVTDFLKLNIGAPDNSLYMDSLGRIGLSTTPKVARLEIAKPNNSNEALSLLAGNTNTDFTNNQITFGYENSRNYLHAIKSRHNGAGKSGNALDFYLWSPADSVDDVGIKHVMTLSGNGNVGIGNTSPFADHGLQIGNNIGFSYAHSRYPHILLNPTSKNSRWQGKLVMDGELGLIVLQGGPNTANGSTGDTKKLNNVFQVHAGAPSGSFYLSPSGNVGIANSDPNNPYKLNVDGYIYSSSSVIATTFTRSSDRRLKSDIQPIPNAGNLVNQLKPVHYAKTKPGSKEEPVREFGFIAQDMRKLLPELVSGVETDSTYLGLDYISLIAVLTKALQEQHSEITALKEQVETLAILVSRQSGVVPSPSGTGNLRQAPGTSKDKEP